MDKKELWLRFACAALANLETGDDIDDDAEDVAKLADAMVEEYEERFATPRRRRGKEGD